MNIAGSNEKLSIFHRFPDLIVIYLGMRVNALTWWLRRCLALGSQIKKFRNRSETRRAPAARKFHHVVDPVVSWHASILARL